MRVLPICLLVCSLSVLPAAAGETAWLRVAPGVSMRLISAGAVNAQGTALFAIEIDMPETTKTYWRVPGETGLPMELDFSASRGAQLQSQHWPFPQREEKDGYLDYVYYGHTVLPLELAISEPAGMVDIKATLGVCSDICVPAQAHFMLAASDAAPDSSSDLRIRQAMATVPIAWDQGEEPVGRARLTPEGDALAVEVSDDIVRTDSLIAATTDGEPLFGAPQKSPQPHLVLLPILGKTDNSALDGVEVELTFMTDMGAYRVSRTIESGGAAASPE